MIPAEMVASALATHPWNSYPKAAHREHGFDSGCAVCKGDVEALANVAVYAFADAGALAGAGLVVVSAEDLRLVLDLGRAMASTVHIVTPEQHTDYVTAQARLRAALPERIENA